MFCPLFAHCNESGMVLRLLGKQPVSQSNYVAQAFPTDFFSVSTAKQEMEM